MAEEADDLGRVVEVWIGPALLGRENITVLTERALCVSTLDDKELKRAKRRLDDGAPVAQVLGRRVKAFPLAALQAVRVSNKEATLSLGYPDGERRASHTIQYMQPQQRKVFAALARAVPFAAGGVEPAHLGGDGVGRRPGDAVVVSAVH